MAFIQPTNQQQAAFQNSERFKVETKWAVYDLANYWKNQNGASLNAADALKWRKHQHYSLVILLNPSIVENSVNDWATDFAIQAGNFSMVDDQQAFNLDDAIDKMLTESQFEAIANIVFEQKVANNL
jgi:hypothetical protein